MLIGAAVWAYFRVEKMKQEGTADHLSAHYLGGRNFGPLLTAGTVFASFFSGYTVVGIVNGMCSPFPCLLPSQGRVFILLLLSFLTSLCFSYDAQPLCPKTRERTEAYKTGWMSLRWMPTSAGIVGGYVLTGLRLRKASMVRNHQSPVDFITDRYQSNVLRYVVGTLQVVTSLIYVSAQVISLENTFNAMFNIPEGNPWPVVIMFALILAFEWAGGLSSVRNIIFPWRDWWDGCVYHDMVIFLTFLTVFTPNVRLPSQTVYKVS